MVWGELDGRRSAEAASDNAADRGLVASGKEAGEWLPPGLVGHDDDRGRAAGGAAQDVAGLDKGMELRRVAAAVGVGVADVVAKGAFDVDPPRAEG
jgi:hypothetical protein